MNLRVMPARKTTDVTVSASVAVFSSHERVNAMDKDRIEGALNQAKGTVKETAGKLVGDAKLQSEGKAEKAAGKIQNAAGSVRDALRDVVDKK